MLGWLTGTPFDLPAPAFAGAPHDDRDTPGASGILFMASNRPRRTVSAGRRRRPSAAPSGGRRRAAAPQRRGESTSGGGAPAYGGGGGTFGGSPTGGAMPFRLGPGRSRWVTILTIIIIVIVVIIRLYGAMNTGEEGYVQETSTDAFGPGQVSNLQPAGDFATNYPSVTAGSPGRAGQTWLVMLYQDADDQILEKDIYLDLNEAEKGGSSDRVTVVSQLDRYAGAYSGDGNWTGTRRFLVSPDDDLGRLASREVADLGEVNMSSGESLVDFVTWAIETYPADKYALILSDHGMGWPGGWTDPTPQGPTDTGSPLSAKLGNALFLDEMEEALGQTRAETGLDRFEVVGLDACLMGQLEVFTALEPHARYAVASEEVEPALGWAYADFLQSLNADPDMGGAELSRLIVQSYIEGDQTIVDSRARADFLSHGSPFSGLFGSPTDVSPQQLAREIGQTSTLTAVDLSKIGALNTGLNKLAYELQEQDQRDLAGGRSYSQTFTSVFGSHVPPSYIDLGNFLQILQRESGPDISASIDAVLGAISDAVVAEKHGPQKPGATGIAIYYPNSQLYRNPLTGAESYTAIADTFAVASLWDDFLAYHYAGQSFAEDDERAVVPSGSLIRAPAAGDISISGLAASRSQVGLGETVTLTADIGGQNIGHIYLFVGYYDRQSNSVFVADRDYLESSDTRQVDGVHYPDWGEGDFTLEFDWEPVVFAVSDGNSLVPALFAPDGYGHTYEEALYTVDGTYTFADGGEELDARLYFVDGVMRQAFGFVGGTDAGAPREITPQPGDRFTVVEEWLDLNNDGEVVSRALQQGDTLTFGDRMFTWETLDAAAGEYVVGFVVEDLDGNRREAFVPIDVL